MHNRHSTSNESKPAHRIPEDLEIYYQEPFHSTKSNLVKTNLAIRFQQAGKNEITVLDLGCGYAFSFLPLLDYFKHHDIKINYMGVDINQDQITAVKSYFCEYRNSQFICADAGNPHTLKKYLDKGSVDLVFIQHPEVLGDDQTQEAFRNIFTRTMPWYLAPTGYFYVSFYSGIETLWTQQNYKINMTFVLPKNFNESLLIHNPPTKLLSEYTKTEKSNISLIPDQYVYCLQVPWGETAAGQFQSFLPEVTEEMMPVTEMKLANLSERKNMMEYQEEKVVPQAGRASQCGMFKVVTTVAVATIAVALGYLSYSR